MDVPKQPYTVPFRCNTLACYVRLPLGLICLVGLGRCKNACPTGISRYAYTAYSLGLLLVLSTCTVLGFAVVDWTKGLMDKNSSYFVAMATWTVQATLTAGAISYSINTRRFDELIRLWVEYRMDDTLTTQYKRWIRKRITLVFATTTCMITIMTTMSIVQSLWALPEMTSQFGSKVMDAIRYGIFTFCTVVFDIVWYVPQYLFFVISLHVACCWRAFDDQIREMSGPYDRILRFAVGKHRQLAEIVNQMNVTFGFYALAMLSTNIVSAIFTLYPFIFATSLPTLQIVVMSLWLAANLIMSIMVGSAALISESAEKISGTLYGRYSDLCLLQAWVSSEPDHLTRETAVVLESMRASKIGVSPCGVFTITKRFFVTIFSIMASYYIVLVQFVFQPAPCYCASNGTAVA